MVTNSRRALSRKRRLYGLLYEIRSATRCEGNANADMLYYTRWVVVLTLYISLLPVPEHIANFEDSSFGADSQSCKSFKAILPLPASGFRSAIPAPHQPLGRAYLMPGALF